MTPQNWKISIWNLTLSFSTDCHCLIKHRFKHWTFHLPACCLLDGLATLELLTNTFNLAYKCICNIQSVVMFTSHFQKVCFTGGLHCSGYMRSIVNFHWFMFHLCDNLQASSKDSL